MTDKKNKHIAEQIANSFNNNNDKSFVKDNLKKFEEARIKVNEQKQLNSVEQTGFIIVQFFITFMKLATAQISLLLRKYSSENISFGV